MANLYLIPSLLSESDWNNVLPEKVKQVCCNTKFFIVENLRTARRFLKKVENSIDINELTFFELNKRTSVEAKLSYIKPLLEGNDVGIISEAGCPGVADPGAEIVELAHRKNIKVIPLVGPSSILMSLMASGMNGQNFAFIGYLPVKPNERTKKIKQIEQRAKLEKQTQIFIETPYRNNQLMEDLVKTCSPSTLLCIACDITSEDELIVTKPVSAWGKNLPNLHKRPTIFLIG